MPLPRGAASEWSAFQDGEEVSLEAATVTPSPIPGGYKTSLVATLPSPPEGAGTSEWTFVLQAGDALGTGMGQVVATVHAPPRASAGAAVSVVPATGGSSPLPAGADVVAGAAVTLSCVENPQPPSPSPQCPQNT